MATAKKPGASLAGVERRAVELDTIASVLPIDRRDELAELLTDADIETLRHLVNEGMGANTLRAITSDLAYIEAWALAATKRSLAWPAPEALLLKFVAHHLCVGAPSTHIVASTTHFRAPPRPQCSKKAAARTWQRPFPRRSQTESRSQHSSRCARGVRRRD